MISQLEFLNDVKNHLNVTWNEDDDRIEILIKEAEQFLLARVGKIDILERHERKSILGRMIIKNHVRYAWSGVSHLFENDYRSDLLNLQMAMMTT